MLGAFKGNPQSVKVDGARHFLRTAGTANNPYRRWRCELYNTTLFLRSGVQQSSLPVINPLRVHRFGSYPDP